MPRKQEIRERIIESGAIAVLRNVEKEDVVPTAEAIHEGGVTAIEVTADATRSTEMIVEIDRALSGTDAIVGAGTVLDAPAARNVIEAGAEFVAAPNLNEAVVEVCNRERVIYIPGVMTPTEANRAMAAGADMLKVFPASTVGPGHISALQGPFGDIDIMPTGGVSAENVAEYFNAGAVAVGAGSALVDYDAIEREDWDSVRKSSAEFVAAVENTRS